MRSVPVSVLLIVKLIHFTDIDVGIFDYIMKILTLQVKLVVHYTYLLQINKIVLNFLIVLRSLSLAKLSIYK